MARLMWVAGEPPFCRDRETCTRALERREATVCRWILGDHDNTERPMWRATLARHLRWAEGRA